MNFGSKCGLVALVSTVAFMTWADAAAAGAEGWRIVDAVGSVRSGAPGVSPVALSNQQVLAADSWVETGKDGRIVLARGQDTIVVSPSSRVQLPDEEVNGNTQILQTLGSALYTIGKQQKPHFQVDTPYLAAVVKGTQFTVSVDGDKSAVAVTEGLVEVTTPDGSDAEFVRPGFTAFVSHDDKKDVVVQETAATEDKAPPTPVKAQRANADGVVTIPGVIGALTVDISTATEGLASSDVPAVTTVATNTTTNTVNAVRTTTGEVVATAVDVVSNVGDTAGGVVVGGVTDVAGGAVAGVGTVVDNTVGTTVGTVTTVVNTVVPTVVETVVNPGGQTLPPQASQTAQNVVTTIVNGVTGGLGGVLGRGR